MYWGREMGEETDTDTDTHFDKMEKERRVQLIVSKPHMYPFYRMSLIILYRACQANPGSLERPKPFIIHVLRQIRAPSFWS